MEKANLPLDTWMVVDTRESNHMTVISTHSEQVDAEAECKKRNRGLGSPRYCACIALEPVAERMGRATGCTVQRL